MVLMLLLLCGALSQAATPPPQKAMVIVAVADVWSRPLSPTEIPSADLRETQVVFGEMVLIHESSGPWVRIEALEQPEFTLHNRWEGYPGWAPAGAFSTRLPKRLPTTRKTNILQSAQGVIGMPYLWGGLTRQSGYDCSGLVHITYRNFGLKIPRDAHEQWMKAKPVPRSALRPADLIFSAKAESPKKITHVALYAGQGQIIEAPQTGMYVRKVSFKEKYGEPLDAVESGKKVGDRVIYFGTYLH